MLSLKASFVSITCMMATKMLGVSAGPSFPGFNETCESWRVEPSADNTQLNLVARCHGGDPAVHGGMVCSQIDLNRCYYEHKGWLMPVTNHQEAVVSFAPGSDLKRRRDDQHGARHRGSNRHLSFDKRHMETMDIDEADTNAHPEDKTNEEKHRKEKDKTEKHKTEKHKTEKHKKEKDTRDTKEKNQKDKNKKGKKEKNEKEKQEKQEKQEKVARKSTDEVSGDETIMEITRKLRNRPGFPPKVVGHHGRRDVQDQNQQQQQEQEGDNDGHDAWYPSPCSWVQLMKGIGPDGTVDDPIGYTMQFQCPGSEQLDPMPEGYKGMWVNLALTVGTSNGILTCPNAEVTGTVSSQCH